MTLDFLDLRIFNNILMTKDELQKLFSYWKCPYEDTKDIHPRLLELLQNAVSPHGGHIVTKDMSIGEMMEIAHRALNFRPGVGASEAPVSKNTYTCTRCGKNVSDYFERGFRTCSDRYYDSEDEVYVYYRRMVDQSDDDWEYKAWISKCSRCERLVCDTCSEYCGLRCDVDKCCNTNDYCSDSCNECHACKSNEKFRNQPNTFEHDGDFLCRNVICNDDCAGTGKRKCLLHTKN